jgi:hypothetical protein
MLALWLFGIGCGIAQACVVAHLKPAPAAAEREATAGGCEHEDDGGLAQAQCRDFCAKASSSIPTLKPAPSDLLVAALPPSVITTVAPVPALVLVADALLRPPDRPARPIAITYGRLAL